MPWPEPCAGSFFYELIVLRRARSQTQYKPVLEDWIWHFSLPMVRTGPRAHTKPLHASREPQAPDEQEK
jgi:hypothetical protein